MAGIHNELITDRAQCGHVLVDEMTDVIINDVEVVEPTIITLKGPYEYDWHTPGSPYILGVS